MIAWTAHFQADLHDARHNKLFDSVRVVSDRTVLDAQLKETISDSSAPQAWWRPSRMSAAARVPAWPSLQSGKKIVVCTIQTFPFALQPVQERAATEDKRFAVITDKVHSSQTGESAAKLKQLLST